MVEGPGCKLKGEKLKPRIKGQHIIAVSTEKAQVQTTKKSQKDGKLQQLVGQTVSDVRTLGKELFIFFERSDNCIRLHFLMSGSFRVNGKDTDGDGGKISSAPILTLSLSTDIVSFYLSACDVMSGSECVAKIEELQSLDICYERFSHKRAVDLFNEQTGRLVCDVLLDQLILPGVGNIIKNEALFDSGIKPDCKVEDLTRFQISHLIKMTRDFTMIFYKCRKTGKPLAPHLKIYNKPVCHQCKTTVVRTRMGDDSGRVTMFCPKCQNNSHTGSLPSKNSLLGWATSSPSCSALPHESEWTCNQCTFLNKTGSTKCVMCLTQKTQSAAPRVLTESNISVPSMPVLRTDPIEGGINQKPSASGRSMSSISKPNPKRRKLGEPDQSSPGKKVMTDPETQNSSRDPKCAAHKTVCMMRRVHKAGENHNRMFWCCPRRECNFFMWADGGFPLCSGHGKRTVLRTVLKQGSNNGKTFYACPLNKNKQCGFFQWTNPN